MAGHRRKSTRPTAKSHRVPKSVARRTRTSTLAFTRRIRSSFRRRR